MDEPEDKSAASGKDRTSSDDYFLNAHERFDGDDVAQLEAHDDDAGNDGEGGGEDDNDDAVELQDRPPQDPRSLQVIQEMQTDGSELSSVDASSVDALPRRVDSPGESMLSGPDDTPSVQVRLES